MAIDNLWDEVEERYFPAIADDTKKLNKVLKSLYGLDLKPDFDTLESVVGGEDISLSQLNNIAREVVEAEVISNEFSGFGYNNPDALRITEQVTETTKSLGTTLKSLKGRKYKELKKTRADLKKNKNNIVILKNLRKEANTIDDFFWGNKKEKGLYDLSDNTVRIPESVECYHANRSNIVQLDNEIGKIKQRYQNFDKSLSPEKELNLLINETKTGFGKSKLVKDCIKAEFYEGLVILKKLNLEMKDVKKDVSGYIEKKKYETISMRSPKYWNNQPIPTDNVIFKANDGMWYDVKTFVQVNDAILKIVVKDNSLNKGSLDDIAYKCEQWVLNNIKYESDEVIAKQPEFWQKPTETLQRGMGDCEDQAYLVASLMLNTEKMPTDRVRVVAGEVKEGGHAWVEYRRKKDDQHVILDTTYKPTSEKIEKRLTTANMNDYVKRYFAANNEHSWDLGNPNDYLTIRTVDKPEPLPEPKKQKKSVLLSEELKKLELPLDTRYHVIEDVLQGRVSSNGWISRIELLDTAIDSLSNTNSLPKTNYPMEVYEKLNDFYNNGYLGKVALFSDQNKETIELGINNLYQFAQKVHA